MWPDTWFVLFPAGLLAPSWKTIFILTIHVLAMIYWSLNDNDTMSAVHQNIGDDLDRSLMMDLTNNNNNDNNRTWPVEIWSKSAIGQYLWENILQATTQPKILPNNLYIEGGKSFGPVTILFRSGPALKPQSLAQFPVENLILILNWRSLEKIQLSRKWLDVVVDRLQSDHHHDDCNQTIKNVGIIALGDEKCNNQWFKQQYLDLYERLRFLLIIYDWNQVDNQIIFQWPLGIATYRDFPPSSFTMQTDLINSPRPYLCNFVATVYPNSTRKELEKLFTNVDDDVDGMKHLKQKCLVKTRSKWSPNEDDHSMMRYVQALRSSDLTLSPVGMNHECYRIMEAVEYGSIPVIEVNHDHLRGQPQCDQRTVLRVFQRFRAPFIYVRNWTEQLPGILMEYDRKSLRDRIRARIDLMKWHHRFKIRLKNTFINIIRKRFQ